MWTCVSRVHLLEISSVHCAAGPASASLRATVRATLGARTGNWFGDIVSLGGIRSQLFHGPESTPRGSDVAVARFWFGWLITDCTRTHLVDFFGAFGLEGKTVDVA